ncbi:MAG: PD-(D/E)XK nuclease family protein [Nanoarchaeota archaeon]|nr:PD-(D/E)XK nuclease family protein [Nanoarchaeota archaeon]MCG2718734.1 PD-(D/E)XK nuclease family protein [Nanoarchaeota archaeon]
MGKKSIVKKEKSINNNYKTLTHCPYCQGRIIKRGKREKKFEEVQRYYCKKCDKSFTSAVTKNKTYPLKVIIDAITLYNRLGSVDRIPAVVKERYGISITSRAVSNWIKEYERYIPFVRMRDFAVKNYGQKDLMEESKLIHQQIYSFKYHRAKMGMILNEEFKHSRFKPLQDFLELVIAECPHQLFQNPVKRASEYKKRFNLEEVKITPKTNFATRIANFVLQAVANNKARHEALQDFMIANDSVTIAVEVPVFLDCDDLRHYKHELNFDVPVRLEDGEHVTGHIDLVQVRNGAIYLMDYKPSAKKEKPIEQLTIYALALSRLTGLRLYHFKCAWFDDKDYFEFFPLHVVYKKKSMKRLPKGQKKLDV